MSAGALSSATTAAAVSPPIPSFEVPQPASDPSIISRFSFQSHHYRASEAQLPLAASRAPSAFKLVSAGTSKPLPPPTSNGKRRDRTAVRVVVTSASSNAFSPSSTPLHSGISDPPPSRSTLYQIPITLPTPAGSLNDSATGPAALFAQPPPLLSPTPLVGTPATASTVTSAPVTPSTPPLASPSLSIPICMSLPPKARRVRGDGLSPPPPLDIVEKFASDCETLGCLGNFCGSMMRPIRGVFRCFTHFLGCGGSCCVFIGCGATSLACRTIGLCSPKAQAYGSGLGTFACKNFNSFAISLDSVKNRVWDAVTAAWKPLAYVFCCCSKKDTCLNAPDECARRVNILYEKNCRLCCARLPDAPGKKTYEWWIGSKCMSALNWLSDATRFWSNMRFVGSHRRTASIVVRKAFPDLEAELNKKKGAQKLDPPAKS